MIRFLALLFIVAPSIVSQPGCKVVVQSGKDYSMVDYIQPDGRRCASMKQVFFTVKSTTTASDYWKVFINKPIWINLPAGDPRNRQNGLMLGMVFKTKDSATAFVEQFCTVANKVDSL